MNQSLLQSAWRAHQSGNLNEAARLYAECLRTNPGDADALYLFAQLHFQVGHLNEAERLAGEAARRRPTAPEIWFLRGSVQQQMNDHAAALDSFGRALGLQSRFPEVLVNRGGSLMMLKRYGDALADFDAALALNPNLAQAWNNRGNALSELGRHAEAADSYARVLALHPGIPQALVNRGTALLAMGRAADARASYDEALRADPVDADALCGRANAAYEQRDYEAAANDYASVLRLAPGYARARGNLVTAKLQICDWHALQSDIASIDADVDAGRPAITPIQYLALSDSPERQLRCASLWTEEKHPPAPQPLWRGEAYNHARIRIAYLSEDFRDHAVATLMTGVWENHDRSKFETYAFSFGPDDGSVLRKRVENAFEHFIDVREKDDAAVAQTIRAAEIDILVDLMGYSGHHRSNILALRPAPVQINYLGHPGTMGAPYIDCILADRAVIPEGQRRHYSEKVAYLPDCFMPADASRAIGPTPSRRKAGLPENAFVFCSFNNSNKFTSLIFDVWMRLLQAVPESVLWLPEGNAAAMRNLRAEAQARSVETIRLVFAPFAASPADHLARLKCADLFLDTLPYNAHATACDALWAGLPLLTCMGQSFASRVAGSLLHAVGLPELTTQTLAEYEALALKLAREPETLRAIREKLARNRDLYPLFDTRRFTRNLETLFVGMREKAG